MNDNKKLWKWMIKSQDGHDDHVGIAMADSEEEVEQMLLSEHYVYKAFGPNQCRIIELDKDKSVIEIASARNCYSKGLNMMEEIDRSW